MRLTVLTENTAHKSRLLAEHGLSLWIETGTHRFLFDTGQTSIVCRNAEQLGIDLSSVDGIVLSHGHYDHTGGPFFEDPGCGTPDSLPDDQALYFDTPAGVVVVLGCAHSGIVNTLQYIRTLCPSRPIRAVIGGTHLVNADENRVAKTITALRELAVGQLYPLHCTGFPAAARLWNEFPGLVAPAPVGSSLHF